jgi:D-alanyl-D-alanine carboxypeptidase/D-alanyl-D-alanine-endopeptidase (penicillin-binding protein 4)
VGSWDSGLALERRFLTDSLGVDATQFRLADGSGLSHWNLITPRAIVQILRRMRTHPRGGILRDALPVAGASGTLRFRFRGTGLTGRVHAKTGTIANVNTLSGYVETRSGTWTFSIQLNHHTAGNRDAVREIEAVVATFAR